MSWLRKVCRTFIITAVAGLAQFACADSETAAAWGPSIGTTAPLLSALDQDGKQQNLASLSSTNGLLFVFNRSVAVYEVNCLIQNGKFGVFSLGK